MHLSAPKLFVTIFELIKNISYILQTQRNEFRLRAVLGINGGYSYFEFCSDLVWPLCAPFEALFEAFLGLIHTRFCVPNTWGGGPRRDPMICGTVRKVRPPDLDPGTIHTHMARRQRALGSEQVPKQVRASCDRAVTVLKEHCFLRAPGWLCGRLGLSQQFKFCAVTFCEPAVSISEIRSIFGDARYCRMWQRFSACRFLCEKK